MFELKERSPIASAPLSVILFAHALSTETDDALQTWRQYLDTLKRAYEIILIQELRLEVPPPPMEESIRVISYDRAVGFREALNLAIHSAQNPLVVFCICDKQYSPSDLQGLLEKIDVVDLVTGFRAGGQAPPWRVLLDLMLAILGRVLIGVPVQQRECWLGSEGWSRRLIARWIFGVRVLDPECPFRLVRREIFVHLPIQSGGPFVNVEILAKANHVTCFLAETPVTWTPPTLPMSDAISFGHDAWRVFRDPDFGPYREGNGPTDEPGLTPANLETS